MANIVINEISDNYTYNIGDNTFATVALPITACWGPALLAPSSLGGTDNEAGFKEQLVNTKWTKFPATRQGLDAFVSAYRGPSSLYKAHKDYSYQMAVTLLTSGYDVLVCRVCGGTPAKGYGKVKGSSATYVDDPTAWGGFIINARYAGTFGNNLRVTITKASFTSGSTTVPFWNAIVSIKDTTGGISAVENFNFILAEPETVELPEYISPIGEIDSAFVVIDSQGIVDSDTLTDPLTVKLGEASGTAGSDDLANLSAAADEKSAAVNLTTVRFTAARAAVSSPLNYDTYKTQINGLTADASTLSKLRYIKHMEFNFTAAYYVFSLLHDKLQYNPQRIVSPWDDQNLEWVDGEVKVFSALNMPDRSPLHVAIMLAAYYGRCGAGLLDVPKSLPQSMVYRTTSETFGYAQALANTALPQAMLDKNAGLFVTHSALFAPWGQYRYVGMNRMTMASPSFLALLIQRAQILNQPIQYEWALPQDRKHNLNIGKMDYEVNKATLDKWQSLEGVGVNVITPIPGLGTNLWGNSTLFDVPPATYQALANLSTRYLMNAVENVAYTVGLTITFQYNNDQAYSTFYAGVTPILDSMKNVGAIRDYRVQMSADINGEDHVNANTVIGKIYLVVEGVINDIVIDLIALPPTVDLATVVG
ncbi:hypothetical protein [Ruminococcus sp.]|uniref:hypothetical protein n=1 Tax=Ruminococcus sp. TaxID=41978 RepID=UPI001B4F0B2F|nr:hypothetical protein [Ruminococcus sp.]MBP5433598.1 hypothetical protein [Ruminococcus sp.]